MNRIELSIFMKKVFDARFNVPQGEWRFSNGDRGYALSIEFEDNRSTYEPHLRAVTMLARKDRSGESAADDIRGSRLIAGGNYKTVGSYDQDRMTREQLRAWIVKTLVTHEFE